MNEQVKIRKIEMDIYNVLRSGIENTLDVAEKLHLTYSAVHSVLNRMVMYEIVQRKGNGLYSPIPGNFVIASDSEVIAYRRKKKDRFKHEDSSTVFNIPTEIVDFVRMQYCSNVERNLILTRLKNNGIELSKFILNQIIYTYGIDREFPQRNKESNNELVTA